MPSSYVLDREGNLVLNIKAFMLDKQSQYETELNSLLKTIYPHSSLPQGERTLAPLGSGLGVRE